jgi:hypothetical protein
MVCLGELLLTHVQVDRDGDGRISYSEFRVMMGAHPLIIH